MAYSRELIDAVLQAADIVTVVSSYINVEKHGRSYKAICPFHNDTNPSLSISKEKQIYKCFVCNAGGNAISFVKNYTKSSYHDAVKTVADLVGFSDPRLHENAPVKKIDEKQQRLYDCINDLNAFYQYGLTVPEGETARKYLEGRNIDESQQKKYGIGYSLQDGEMTIRYLQNKGYSLKNLEDIGITFAKINGSSDSNAGRVTFPIHDANGQVVGFSARRLDAVHDKKYVNSKDGPIFHKGQILYNYHNVVQSARHDGYCYVLEGFMDVMALDRAGLPNAVALMGTAFTEEQAELLRRLRCELRLCLDGDAAGQNGMMKMSSILSKNGIPYRFVDYGGDKRDPDEILQQEGKEALKAKMETLIDPVDFQISYYQNTRKLETPEERKQVLLAFLPHVISLNEGIEREDYIVKLSKITKYEPDAIRNLIKQGLPKKEQMDGFAYREDMEIPLIHPERRILQKMLLAERTILYYMLQNNEAVEFFRNYVKDFTDDIYEEVAMSILEYARLHPGKVDTSGIISLLQEKESKQGDEGADLVSQLAFEKNYVPFSMKQLEDCLKTITEEKAHISASRSTKMALTGNDMKKDAQLIAEFAKRKGQSWPNKKKGESSS